MAPRYRPSPSLGQHDAPSSVGRFPPPVPFPSNPLCPPPPPIPFPLSLVRDRALRGQVGQVSARVPPPALSMRQSIIDRARSVDVGRLASAGDQNARAGPHIGHLFLFSSAVHASSLAPWLHTYLQTIHCTDGVRFNRLTPTACCPFWYPHHSTRAGPA